MMYGWIYLLAAGFCEIMWAVGLKYTANFSKIMPTVLVLFCMFLSVLLLNFSLKTIPLSIAYAVWTGMGVIGTVLFGIFLLKEPLNCLKLISLIMIIVGIIGCKLSQ